MGGARGGQPCLDRPGGPGPVRQRQQRLPVPARPARLHPRRSRLRGRHRRLDRLQPQPVDDPDLRPGRARGRRPDRGAGGGLRTARPGVRRQPGRGPGRGAGEPGRRLRRDGRGVHPGLAGLDGGPHPARAGPAGPAGQPRRPGWPTRCGSRRWCCGPTPTTPCPAPTWPASRSRGETTPTTPAATTWCGAGTAGRPRSRSRRPGTPTTPRPRSLTWPGGSARTGRGPGASSSAGYPPPSTRRRRCSWMRSRSRCCSRASSTNSACRCPRAPTTRSRRRPATWPATARCPARTWTGGRRTRARAPSPSAWRSSRCSSPPPG